MGDGKRPSSVRLARPLPSADRETPMKLTAPSLLTLTLIPLLALPLSAGEPPKDPGQAEKTVRDILVQIDKAEPGWKGRFAGWKERFEALLTLAKAGPAVVPVLEKTSKDVAGPAPLFAAYALRILRGPADVTKALADFDPKKIDTARLGQLAPDFTLSDPTGKAYRLSQYRGKKTVVLIFLITED